MFFSHRNASIATICVLFSSITAAASSNTPAAADTSNDAHKAASAAHGMATSCTPEEALDRLMEGNKHFVENRLEVCRDTTPQLREDLAKGQHPFAVVLSCSDSRLPPEIIFDKKPGDIFVVRVAGNTVDPVNLASIEYALEHLGATLILVLGHERCGAVTAAYDTFTKTGLKHASDEEHHERSRRQLSNMEQLLNQLRPAVDTVNKRKGQKLPKAEMVELAIDENIRNVTKNLTKQSPVIRKLVEENKVRIASAKFDLDTGSVKVMGRKECIWIND